VIVVSDRMPGHVHAGDALALDIHVVNDLRAPLDGAEVVARLSWEGGEQRWRFRGNVDADGCARVGTLQFVVPNAAGALMLDLTLEHPAAAATNRYAAPILQH
jgi:hypothetical protein